MSVAEVLKRARTEAGVSQASLARRAGTSQAAISRIERGKEEPSLARLQGLLACLGLRVCDGLEAIAEHDEEPRRLVQQARRRPDERLRDGLSLARFARRLHAAGERSRRERAPA